MVALVTPEVGDGPLNTEMDGAAGLFSKVALGALVMFHGEQLLIRDLRVDLRGAAVWEALIKPGYSFEGNVIDRMRDSITHETTKKTRTQSCRGGVILCAR